MNSLWSGLTANLPVGRCSETNNEHCHNAIREKTDCGDAITLREEGGEKEDDTDYLIALSHILSKDGDDMSGETCNISSQDSEDEDVTVVLVTEEGDSNEVKLPNRGLVDVEVDASGSIEVGVNNKVEEKQDNYFDVSPETVAAKVDAALEEERSKRRHRRTPTDPSAESFVFSDVDEKQNYLTCGKNRQQKITVHTTKRNAIQELCMNLRHYPESGLSRPDPELLSKVVDFHRARYQRRAGSQSRPWGLLGLFLYVGELRADLQWAEDAAWRHANEKQAISWKTFVKFHSHEFKRSYFVYLIELLSIVMMTIAMWMNDWKFAPITENPMLGPSAKVLMDLGALNSEAVVEHHEWYRLFAPFVLHAGLIHLLINMLALHFICGPVERTLGSTLTAAIFLLSGLGGNIASALFIQNAVSVGASGGLFGLLGLCLANILANWDIIALRNYRDPSDPAFEGFPRISVALVLATEMLVNMTVGLTPYVDNFAHLGGLLYGFLFAFPLLLMDSSGFSLRKIHSQCHVFFIARMLSFITAALLFCLTAVSLANYDGQESLCKSCKYVSCAPFPFWTDEPWWYCDDCHKTQASWISYHQLTFINITCPYGEKISTELAGGMTSDDVVDQMIELCREYCPV